MIWGRDLRYKIRYWLNQTGHRTRKSGLRKLEIKSSLTFMLEKCCQKTHQKLHSSFSHREPCFVNTLSDGTNHVNSQTTYIHCENNAYYLICWPSYGMENVTETSSGNPVFLGKEKQEVGVLQNYLILPERLLHSGQGWAFFMKSTFWHWFTTRPKASYWLFMFREWQCPMLPSKAHEDSYWEVAEKEIMQFLCHLYKVKTEPSPLTSMEVGQYLWP